MAVSSLGSQKRR